MTTPVVFPRERNYYFYGRLLDEDDFRREQAYLNGKRWMLNRLLNGHGVVSGLNVVADAANPGHALLNPGVALDAWGRELVVPVAVAIDATRLTDSTGAPAGPAPAAGSVLISLAYRERKTDPVPVLVSDCDAGNCAPSIIREEYVVLVSDVAAAPIPTSCTLGLPAAPGPAWHALLAAAISAPARAPPAVTSVPLARFDLAANTVDSAAERPLVYGNDLLFQMLVCLAETVGKTAGAQLLLYDSGDGQSAKTGAALAQPLIVRVVDSGGNPVTGATVAFTILTGGGSAGPVTETPGGKYQVTWTMGPAGPQSISAKALGVNLDVVFHATATP